MKFLFTTTVLASLVFGATSYSKSETKNHASDRDAEDFAYWRGLIDTVDSMATTDAPTKSPVLRPTPAPIDPTSVPIAPVPVPTPEPVDPTPAPVPEPEPIDPTPAPVPEPEPVGPTPAPIDPTSVPASCQSIAEVVCTTPEFDTLCSLVNTAGIYDVLISDTMTFFGPTNTAFEKLPERLLDAALYDIDLLTFILFGHVVSNQAMLTRDFVCENGPIDSLIMANDETTTIQCTTFMDSEGNTGSNTFVVGDGNSDALAVPPMIIGPNGMACNGIIHALDGVILPAPEEPPTDAPVVDPTLAPVGPVSNPTAAPITPTTEPVIPTGAPADPTTAPIEPTTVPIDPTAVPIDPTAVPIVPTGAPTVGTSGIQARLTPFALNGGVGLEDTNSYQYKALKQVELQVGVDDFSDAKLTQYYALYCIYFATNGISNQITDADPRFVGIPFPNWLVITGWDQIDVDPCDWYGIVCDSQSRVSTIDLFENLLTGAFPPEVSLLSLDGPYSTGGGNLFRVDIFRNEFCYNNADNSWMSDLGSNMTTIIVEETAFAGDIPRLPEFLVNFDISFAFFTGGLTEDNFEGLDKLSFVDLDGNAFNSTIPSVFGRLPSLEFLYLSDSFLSGDLSYMEGMSSIREHWIDTNPGLKGPIYDFIGDITTLESWSMTFNSVTGTLPTTLGNLENMKQMWLYSNQLTGTIPSELGNLSNMKILQLEGNALSGSMPPEICANTAFPTMIIETLGVDCDVVDCSCCTCCSVLECTT